MQLFQSGLIIYNYCSETNCSACRRAEVYLGIVRQSLSISTSERRQAERGVDMNVRLLQRFFDRETPRSDTKQHQNPQRN